MADELSPESSEADSEPTESVADETAPAEAPEAAPKLQPAPVEPESGTKGILREAIQKVRQEIAYHEREAKKHLQQARDLRRDLRESFAFLLDQEAKEKRSTAPEEPPASLAAEGSTPENIEAPTTQGRRSRARRKKRRAKR